MQYFWNGERISESRAAWLFFGFALHHGHEMPELDPIWLARKRCEEARELLAEISDYALEIIAA